MDILSFNVTKNGHSSSFHTNGIDFIINLAMMLCVKIINFCDINILFP
jgi:hypothetical protein